MKKIAVLVPCYNEELTIEKVIKDFQKEVPDAEIFVYDNNSQDRTSEIAKNSGAIVKKESLQGKGNVVRSMFRDIDADVYIMVDGDDTYPASAVKKMIIPIANGNADLVVGDRLSNDTYHKENKRNFHSFGNDLVKKLINNIFKANLSDIMSGYRAFSRRFVKNYPVLCDGFQVETDMTIFALDRKLHIREISIVYRDRPDGSESKLNTFSDGRKVLMTILNLYRHYKPLYFFGILATILLVLSVIVGIPVVMEFLSEQYVYRVPSAVLATGLIILSLLSLVLGLILDSVRHGNKELLEIKIKK